jgi:hypothetical protein
LQGGGPAGPPPAASIPEHLQRVFFRIQQADYFVRVSRDPHVAPLSPWAQDFFQLARRAYEGGDSLRADENAKCAEEVVKALEAGAQAVTARDNQASPPPVQPRPLKPKSPKPEPAGPAAPPPPALEP